MDGHPKRQAEGAEPCGAGKEAPQVKRYAESPQRTGHTLSEPKPSQLLKIVNALDISINVFMDFDIETVSDVLSLILKRNEQLDMVFEAERYEDESFNPSTIKISFKNPLLNHNGRIHESKGIAGEPFK